ncbi:MULTISPECIES: hypothetical protein [Cylindrospermopsis]|uniref:hypothetical protein n=1 Tax=Cylindrospermopsis TaxID=77021 RepID=UPI0007095894|nr:MULTISPECIES: hypothetical protein [Cylindrospermopsis]KRH98376.1 hypothetical protein ASL19_12235 [Cylindrospermopsis sp. CR12]UJL33102.1 hypothetical protein C6N34_013365 [Cylindrospermopsis raciborskii Cr2010]UJL33108.1 hypothetical protein C6N34_013425 [Cylindrospermopsis raciborskii Cr2010]UJS05604.1 hypothetical protein L3I90_05025 [Cylindrospermopsis raciborskii KLL07]UJS05615.1 hypothetical protein L3I90_05085 [Cylindrospermopsis raciborskii KLL07]
MTRCVIEICNVKPSYQSFNTPISIIRPFNTYGPRQSAQLVGWEPLYGGREGFKQGLAETAEWFMNPTNLAGYKSDRYNI